MNDEQMHKELMDAANIFKDWALKAITTDGRLHAETLIASVARMSGSLMYRSFNFDSNIKPGTTVLSDQANIFGPKLLDLMLVTLNSLGNKIQESDISRDYPSNKVVQLSFQESHERLALFYLKYCEVAPMDHRKAAFAAAVTTGIVVHECSQVLSVDKGAAIAVYGFVEGTKTAPFPLTSSQENSFAPATVIIEKKPWYKFWQRLSSSRLLLLLQPQHSSLHHACRRWIISQIQNKSYETSLL